MLKKKKIDKKVLYSVLAVAVLAFISFVFFFPDAMEGNQLQQHDIMQGLANGQEGKVYHEQTGETTRWTNSLFGGMPNFQIAPSYASSGMLDWISKVYTLGLPSPSNLLFAMFLGFFILCLCMDMKWYTALLGAIAWGFSTYFIIIIGAGHIWKFIALSYIPPTIGGIILCYRGRYLAGTAIASLFAALQLQGNHPQMSYYFVLLIAIMVITWFVIAVKQKTLRQWSIATLCTLLAGVLGLFANSPSLYNSYEYSKETIRGKSTDISSKADGTQAQGADFDYITAWSYGPDETMTLLIPNVKGGASLQPIHGENYPKSVADTPGVQEMVENGRLSIEESAWLSQSGITQYFGEQPMTNGPVYVGAIILWLSIVAMFVVKNPIKWALFAGTVLSILLAWGYHFEPLSRFFIDHFPLYNKFRTVSSILVVAEFTIPLLAMMCVQRMLQEPRVFWAEHKKVLLCTAGVLIFFCIIGIVFPEIYGNTITTREQEAFGEAGLLQAPEFANIMYAIRQGRLSLVSGDSLRSLIFLVSGVAAVWFFLCKGKDKPRNAVWLAGALTALTVVDLYSVNKRYVNTDNFVPAAGETVFEPTAADQTILRDTAMNYRVMDYTDFGGARSSYFHKTIGGYHAAKLTRYNDLIEHQISKGNAQVLNMLNAKYVITADSMQNPVALPNPGALGNAWFVNDIKYVETPQAEMDELTTLQPATRAVSDKKFASILGNAQPRQPGDTIYETSYAPNRLTYHASSAKGGLAVFSEVFFPWGWKATIDGKPAQIGRANYVLRAMKVPAGSHTIEMTFDPESIHVTNAMAIASIVLIYLLCLGALAYCLRPLLKRK